jgi:hypothetical protein
MCSPTADLYRHRRRSEYGDGERLAPASRSPEIMADAADLSRYGGGERPLPDLFLD